MMRHTRHDLKQFVVALSHKGEVIRKKMVDYRSMDSNLTTSLTNGETLVHEGCKRHRIVKLLDSGIGTHIGTG